LLGGIVAADRILTLQESPYQLSADLQIPYGVTLQTEPGVVVYGNAKALVVAGTFLAKGTSDKPIRIRGLKIEQGGSASAKPHRIELDHVDMSGGTLYAPGTDTEYGSLRLVDSRLSDVGSYLNIWYPTGDVLVERNVFSHCGGFHVGFKASPVPIQVVIRNNYFGDWTTTYAVENYASYDSAKGVLVEHNTFASTDRPALGLEDECDACRMTAENNWWLTTNAQAIAGRIVDANDNVRIGSAIPFEPALSAPHPQTPLP
jgi:hypothetical protein